jgi:hypothetical protein
MCEGVGGCGASPLDFPQEMRREGWLARISARFGLGSAGPSAQKPLPMASCARAVCRLMFAFPPHEMQARRRELSTRSSPQASDSQLHARAGRQETTALLRQFGPMLSVASCRDVACGKHVASTRQARMWQACGKRALATIYKRALAASSPSSLAAAGSATASCCRKRSGFLLQL